MLVGKRVGEVAGRRPGTSHLCRPAALGTGTAGNAGVTPVRPSQAGHPLTVTGEGWGRGMVWTSQGLGTQLAVSFHPLGLRSRVT